MEGNEKPMSTENGAQANQQAPSLSWQKVPVEEQRPSVTWQKVPVGQPEQIERPEQSEQPEQPAVSDDDKTTMLDPSMAPFGPTDSEQPAQPVQVEQAMQSEQPAVSDDDKTTMLDPSMAPFGPTGSEQPEQPAQPEQPTQPVQVEQAMQSEQPAQPEQPTQPVQYEVHRVEPIQPVQPNADKTTSGMASMEVAAAAQAAEAQGQPAAEQAPQPKRKSKTFKIVAAAVAVVAVIGIGIGAFFVIQGQTYDKATADYAAGNYAQAAEGFKGLGGYQDAAAMYEKSTRWVEAQAAEKEAEEKKDAELWRAAAAAYEAVGDDATAESIEWCNGNADYYTAKAMLEKSPTDRKVVTDALALFEKCPDVEDAEAQASYCENVLKYYEAGDLYAEGRYYDAYKTYRKVNKAAAEKLGDVEAKMNECIQPLPGNGIVERNTGEPDVCELKIVNEGNPNAYYKLYMGDELAMTVFIAAGETATFRLPAGTYSMNKGYGDTWFGTTDMFGDEGHYFKCDFGGNATVDLEPNYGYEISASAEGTSVGAQAAGRDKI